ncbi:MAG: sulfite exporter TauE/SafE family protein [Oscillatoriales cyanobacterium RM2_1_1]|nr:sulfite exporter TauE/SafE family protein [Oscillatoriales cyanobacterium SM2_3_0]NJO46787.1 sulfite exporter TauE/SafE family protein [Oscillatoriales cyanobacterium RM2_1_1]
MALTEIVTLICSGLLAGILAGFLGIGGGVILVPILVSLGYEPIQAVATSSLSIFITALSGSIQNWRMGYLKFNQVLGIGFPALITAQIGAYLANKFSPQYLLTAFGGLLLLNVYLIELKKQVTHQQSIRERKRQDLNQSRLKSDSEDSESHSETLDPVTPFSAHPVLSRSLTGGIAGFLAGFFGVGGGVIMVPLQILLLNETIKMAIQTSLGVIVITAISACLGHARLGNVMVLPGVLLGLGGLVGAQLSTRFLPKLSDRVISFSFRILLIALATYIFWQAIHYGMGT